MTDTRRDVEPAVGGKPLASRRERLIRAGRGILRSRPALAAGALVGLYGLAGFLLVPGLIERSAPRYVAERLGAHLTLGTVRVNPFLLTLEARDVTLAADGAPPALSAERLYVDVALAGLFRRAWTLADLQLDGFTVDAAIEPGGRLNLAPILDRLRADPAAPPREPPRIVFRHVRASGTATFTDRAAGTPARVSVTPIALELYDLATFADQGGRYSVAASLPDGGRIAWRGQLALHPIASDGELSITGFALAGVWPFAAERIAAAPPEGTVALELRYRFAYTGARTMLAVDGIRLQADRVVLRGAAGEPPLVELASARVAGGRFDLERRELRLDEVALRDGAVRASVDAGGALDWARLVPPGGTATAPRSWVVLADTLTVENVALHYADRSRSPAIAIDAERVDAAASISVRATDAGHGGLASDVRIAAMRTVVSGADDRAALLRLDSLEVTGGRLDTTAREIGAVAVSVNGGEAAAVFDEDGTLELARVLAPPRGGALRREAETLAREARASGRPWRYALDRASLEDLRLDVGARGYAAPVRYHVAIDAASLERIAGDGNEPIQLTARVRAGERGTLQAAGAIAQDFAGAQVKVTADGIDLAPLAPVLARHAALDLASGRASLAADVRYAANAAPRVSATGTFGVADLLLNEAGTTERFLAWRALDASRVSLELAPGRLAIGEVRVQAPGAKIAIDAERRLNLAQVLRRGADRPPPGPKAAGFPVRVARVTLRDGTVDFSDLSLALPFATRVRRLNGTVVGIASDRASRAELRLAGLVQDSGSARAEGALQTSDPTAFTDIRADFNNVALPPLSPYSVTFAGRRIESGRLWLDLHYRIVDRRLTAENGIVLDDFRLGERVETQRALDLPLDLAVALLADENGRISVAVPMAGDLGSPRFDYGRLVREALANLVTRVVTAPFRFLKGLAGGSGDIETVHFEPGRAGLEPPERETLARVASALADRPQLKLVVRGPYDPQRDGEALRDRAVRRAVAEALGVRLAAREDPGPIAFDDAETQRALERLLAQRAGADSVDRLAAAYEARTGRKPERVNPFFAVFGRASADREFYEAVFRRLVELAPFDESALHELAARRSRAIVEHLRNATGLDPRRIETGELRAVDSKGEPAVQAELGVQLMQQRAVNLSRVGPTRRNAHGAVRRTRALRRRPALTGPSASEHEHAQEHPEDENDEKDRQRDEKQDLGGPARPRSDAREAEESRDERDDEEDDRPLEHRGRPLALAGIAAPCNRDT